MSDAFHNVSFDKYAFDVPAGHVIIITADADVFAGGTSVQFKAAEVLDDSSQIDVTTQCLWSSSNPAVINVAQDGTAQIGFAAGSAVITAVLP